MNKKRGSFKFNFAVLVVAAMIVAACTSPAGASGGKASPSVAPTNAAAATTAPVRTATTGAVSTATGATSTTTSATSTPAAAVTATGAAAATGPVKNPDTLVEANISDPESLDPAWEYDQASSDVIFNVYETLLFPNKSSTTDFVPMLATSWDISQDGKTYTFHIRQGVKFHLGQSLTPQDVAYSFWRGMIQDRSGGPQWIMLEPFFGLDVQSFQDDVVTKQFGGNFANAAKAVEQAVTFDNAAGTVTLHLKQPYGPMLQILAGTWASIVSMPWVTSLGGWNGDPTTAQQFHDPTADKDELFKVMNGTGPYQFVRWQPSQEVDLVANPNYWLKTPLWTGGPSGVASVKNVLIKDVGEFGTRFAMLKTGDADISYVDTQYISQVDPLASQTCDASGNCKATSNTSGPLRVFKGLPSLEETSIFFNENVNTTGGNATLGSGTLDGNGVPANFFSDIHIRNAFNDCFDWNTYIQQIYNGEAVQGYGPIIQGELGFDPNQAHFTFDLTKCASEFQASTLKSADGKSLWDTGFYMQYIYNTGNDQRKTAGEILAQDLLKVNPKFHLSVVDEPFPLLLKDQVSGRMPIFMLGWNEDYHDPQDWVGPFLSSGGTYASTQHFPTAVQAQMDQLITQGASTTDTATRAKIYAQLQNLAYQNALDLFVVQPEIRYYNQVWVKGYYYNPIFNTNTYFYALSKGK